MNAASSLRAVCIVSLAGLAACRTPPGRETLHPSRPEAMARFAEATRLDLQGQGDAAVTNYLRALALDPDDEELHYRVVTALLQRRRFDEAEAVMQRLVRRRPESPKARTWLALVYRTAERNPQAEEVYRQLLADFPKHAPGYIEFAGFYVRQNDSAHAMEVLDRAMAALEDPVDAVKLAAELTLRRVAIGTEKADSPRVPDLARRLEAAAAKHPDDDDLKVQLGEYRLIFGRPAEALALFTDVVERRPEDAALQQKIGTCLAALGDRAKAIETLEEAVRTQPRNARLRLYLAQLCEEAGDLERAQQALREAAKVSPRVPAIYLKLAVLELRDNPGRAVDTLQKGRREMPGDPALAEFMAYVLSLRHDDKEAVRCFEAARRLQRETGSEPLSPLFPLSYARSLQRSGAIDRAAALLDEVSDDQPLFVSGFAELSLQDDDPVARAGAMQVLETLAARAPDKAIASLVGRALLCSAAEDFATAVSLFEQAEKAAEASADPKETLTAAFYFWFGSACERNGQLARAETLLRTCLKDDPEHAEAYNYLAYMWAERATNLAEALSFSRKSLELVPDNPAFLDTLGWIFYAQGKYEDALRELAKAANLMPDDPTLVEHMGDVMDKLGRADRALTYWKRSFALDAGQARVEEKLQKLNVDLAPLREEAAKLKAEREKEKERRIPGVEDAP